MIGAAGAVAQAIWRWRTIADDVQWTWLMSDTDWGLKDRFGRTPPDYADTLWRRAANLLQKRFDPDMGGDLWPDICKTARQIRRQALSEKPLDMLVRQQVEVA